MRSSLDEPFVYLRFKGIVKHRYSNNELIGYHISITDILESKDVIQKYMNRKRFRVYTRNKIINKVFYVYDILQGFSFKSAFIKRYEHCQLDVHSALVFKTEEQMITNFKKINEHLITSLSENLTVLRSR